jgi:hypothetical protein
VASWFYLELYSEEPRGPGLETGGGRELVQGAAGPAFTRNERRIPALIRGRRVEVFALSGVVRATRRDEFRFTARVASQKHERFTYKAVRPADLALAQIYREDDELLLLI